MLQPYLAPNATSPIYIDGDTHITTTNSVHYDFQAAGEFISLRDPNGLEIQTRQAPVPTSNAVADSHSELPVCVSVNTAVAARMGMHPVSYQPSTKDLNRLELFVDGNSTTVSPNGLDLSGGGRLAKTSATGGIEFDFPDGSVLFITPNWWAGQGIWYFNISLTRLPAIDGTDAGSFPIGGIAGPIESGDWLPRLPDGSSMGPKPGTLHDRYIDLYQKFADAWRVTDESSLFSYANGTSTDTFTLRSWPPSLNSPCTMPRGELQDGPKGKPVKSVKQHAAMRACLGITDEHARENCIFDVRVTGNLGFAETYRRSQCALTTSTRTTLTSNQTSVGTKESTGFTATVTLARADGNDIPTGSVQFMVDGRKVGKPVRLDANGQARWEATSVRIGKHKVSATYIPDQKKKFSPSLSTLTEHNLNRN